MFKIQKKQDSLLKRLKEIERIRQDMLNDNEWKKVIKKELIRLSKV